MEVNNLKLPNELINLMKQKIQNFDKVCEQMEPHVAVLRKKIKEKAAEDVNICSELTMKEDFQLSVFYGQKTDEVINIFVMPYFETNGDDGMKFAAFVAGYYYSYYFEVFRGLGLTQKMEILNYDESSEDEAPDYDMPDLCDCDDR